MLTYLSEIDKGTEIKFNRNSYRESNSYNLQNYTIVSFDLWLKIRKPEKVPYYICGTVYLQIPKDNITCELYTYIIYRACYDCKNSPRCGVIMIEEVREEYFTWINFYTYLLQRKFMQERKNFREFILSNNSLKDIELTKIGEEFNLYDNSDVSKKELKELI